MNKVFVSGCINGPRIRFNETNVSVVSEIWDRWVAEGRLVRFCAELAAGFPTPRPPAELLGGTGSDVLIGTAVVVEDTGDDVTDLFVAGAGLALARAKSQGCVVALLTDGSPTCGATYVYSGTFDGSTRPGRGVTAQLLEDNGIKTFPEAEIRQADAYLRSLE